VLYCKSFLVTEAETKHVRRRARFQQHRDASCHQVPPPPSQGKVPKEIHAILTETLGGRAPSYITMHGPQNLKFSSLSLPCSLRHTIHRTARGIIKFTPYSYQYVR
jgi:hypothetical protein